MENREIRTVVVNEHKIVYCLERKNVKNLNLRVRKDGNVFASANFDVSYEKIDNFVCSRASFIFKSIDKFQRFNLYRQQPKNYVSGETFYVQGRGLRLKVLKADKDSVFSDGIYIYLSVKEPENFKKKQNMINKFLNQQCKDVFNEIINNIYPIFSKYGVDMPVLRIRDMKTRWGSCLAKKGIITLNNRLIEAPRSCIEYVIMHEMCHFIHPNHSKEFYNYLTMLMPDWQERKKALEKNAVYYL